MRPAGVFAGLLITSMLSGCLSAPQRPAAAMQTTHRQLVLVLTDSWDSRTGELHRFERKCRGGWREVDSAFAVTVGRNGSAWGIGLHPAQSSGPQKREGDGKAPAGVFAIGIAFGYARKPRTGLDYQPMQASDWCVDVPGSPFYNRLVDTDEVGAAAIEGSTEPMRRDIHLNGDQKYRLGFVIDHNPQGAVDRGGSCIFAHLWKAPGQPTAGCTAMADEDMQGLLRWLQHDADPRFVLLPKSEYQRLQREWDLPVVDAPVVTPADAGIEQGDSR